MNLFRILRSCHFPSSLNCGAAFFVLFGLMGFGAKAFASEPIKIGSKRFTESHVLATLTGILFRKNGLSAEILYNVGSPHGPRELLEEGKIDLYWEYTGTAYHLYFKGSDPNIFRDSEKLFEYVRKEDQKRDLIWLPKAKLNNTYVVFMREEIAKRHGIKTISDFGQWIKSQSPREPFITLFAFYSRPDGLRGLMKEYQFSIPNIKTIHSYTAQYRIVHSGRAIAGIGFNTNPELEKYHLIKLIDNRQYFSVYNPAPVIQKSVVEQYPKVKILLEQLANHLGEDDIIRLNYEIDFNKKSLTHQCESWLEAKKLL